MTTIRITDQLPGETNEETWQRIAESTGAVVMSPEAWDAKVAEVRATAKDPEPVKVSGCKVSAPLPVAHMGPSESPKGAANLCRTCRAIIPPTGKRGRPAVLCPTCKEKK